MALRFRNSIFVAFGLLVLYFLFRRDDTPFENGSHTIDVLKGATDTFQHDPVDPQPPEDAAPRPKPSVSSSFGHGVSTSSATSKRISTSMVADEGSSTTSAVVESTSPAVPVATSAPVEGLTLQEQFEMEYDALGL
jgi:hypothetical protein